MKFFRKDHIHPKYIIDLLLKGLKTKADFRTEPHTYNTKKSDLCQKSYLVPIAYQIIFNSNPLIYEENDFDHFSVYNKIASFWKVDFILFLLYI